MKQETEDVCLLFHLFGKRLSTAMSCFVVDTNQHWRLATLTLLQTGCKLERMGRNNTVVMVGCRDKSGRIAHTWLQSMEGGIALEILKHLRTVGTRTVIGSPVPTDGELMIAQHIHHSHCWDANTVEVGTLSHTSSYQQASIATAIDGKMVGIGIFLADEPLGC